VHSHFTIVFWFRRGLGDLVGESPLLQHRILIHMVGLLLRGVLTSLHMLYSVTYIDITKAFFTLKYHKVLWYGNKCKKYTAFPVPIFTKLKLTAPVYRNILNCINPSKTKRVCFIQGLSAYRAVNTLHLGYKNQSLNVL
jgi:hypothetical protein